MFLWTLGYHIFYVKHYRISLHAILQYIIEYIYDLRVYSIIIYKIIYVFENVPQE